MGIAVHSGVPLKRRDVFELCCCGPCGPCLNPCFARMTYEVLLSVLSENEVLLPVPVIFRCIGALSWRPITYATNGGTALRALTADSEHEVISPPMEDTLRALRIPLIDGGAVCATGAAAMPTFVTLHHFLALLILLSPRTLWRSARLSLTPSSQLSHPRLIGRGITLSIA